MDNYESEINRYSYKAYCALQDAIRFTCRLSYECSLDRINTNKNTFPDLLKWVYVQSFMARKLCAHFHGATDYEPENLDLKFDYIKKEMLNEY